jgi:ABC-type dipeptide/oligopeptide/nickel transport system permease subunit
LRILGAFNSTSGANGAGLATLSISDQLSRWKLPLPGGQPPTPGVGATSSLKARAIFTSSSASFSGAAIVLLSPSFNIAGDALRDALDPGLKGRN